MAKGKMLRMPVGALRLPLPTTEARTDYADDGTLTVIDNMPVQGLQQFLAELGEWVRTSVVEPPRTMSLLLENNLRLIFDSSEVEQPQRAGHMADTIVGIVEGLKRGELDPKAFELKLDCGCGLRVEKKAEAPQGG